MSSSSKKTKINLKPGNVFDNIDQIDNSPTGPPGAHGHPLLSTPRVHTEQQHEDMQQPSSKMDFKPFIIGALAVAAVMVSMT